MPGHDFFLNPDDTCDVNDAQESSNYTLLFLLMGIVMSLTPFALARLAESINRLDYESRPARIMAGFLVLMMRAMHTSQGDLEIANTEKKIVTIGPHRTSWEAIALASKMRGSPPRFFATDSFDNIPGIANFLRMFKAIPVPANPTKSDGSSSNTGSLALANKALDEGGCVALFPQGNFSLLGEKPHRVYSGAAKLALQHKIPIHVFRLDGFWSLQNPLIPLLIRNSTIYRAFFSGFHPNNVRAKLCCLIDFHLQPENEQLSHEAKIEEICAQLYAYYRHTNELTDKQIEQIKPEITSNRHLQFWNNKVKQDALGKELLKLAKEEEQLGANTFASM